MMAAMSVFCRRFEVREFGVKERFGLLTPGLTTRANSAGADGHTRSEASPLCPCPFSMREALSRIPVSPRTGKFPRGTYDSPGETSPVLARYGQRRFAENTAGTLDRNGGMYRLSLPRE